MSYGNSVPDAYRQAGVYAGRILNGAPSLPICRGRAAHQVRAGHQPQDRQGAWPHRVGQMLVAADEVIE